MATLKHPPFPADAPHLAVVQKRLTLQVDQAPPGPPGPTGPAGPIGPQGVPGPGVINYSAAEQNTGTTWLDGKHIYQKTINTGAVSANKTVPHGIPNIANLVRMWGWASDGSTNALPLPFPDTSGSAQSIGIWADPTNVYITGSRTPNVTASYVTLHYTCTNR